MMNDIERQALIRTIDVQNAEAAERLRYSIGYAQSGLQALTLINGGALVALFTFVGSSSGLKFNFSALWIAFAFFAVGLVMNILSYLGAYLAQDKFYLVTQGQAWNSERKLLGREGDEDLMPNYRRGEYARILAILFAVLALISFIVGSGFALAGVATR